MHDSVNVNKLTLIHYVTEKYCKFPHSAEAEDKEISKYRNDNDRTVDLIFPDVSQLKAVSDWSPTLQG